MYVRIYISYCTSSFITVKAEPLFETFLTTEIKLINKYQTWMSAPSLNRGGSHQHTPQTSVRGDGGGQRHHSRTLRPPLDTRIYQQNPSAGKSVPSLANDGRCIPTLFDRGTNVTSENFLPSKIRCLRETFFSQPQILCRFLFQTCSLHHPWNSSKLTNWWLMDFWV